MAKKYGLLTFEIPVDLIINVENIYPLMEDELEEKTSDLQGLNAQALRRKSFIMKWNKDFDDRCALEELIQIQNEKSLLEDSFVVETYDGL